MLSSTEGLTTRNIFKPVTAAGAAATASARAMLIDMLLLFDFDILME